MAVNVTDPQIGAKGDGKQDDTNSIQRAIDSRTPVYFPPGNYLVTRSLVYHSGSMLFGEGEASKIWYTGSSAALMDSDPPNVTGSPTIKGLRLYRDSSQAGSIGLDCGSSMRGLFQDLWIENFNVGVSIIRKCGATRNFFNYFANVRVAGERSDPTARGFVIGHPGETGGANCNHFMSCEAYQHIDCGFDFVQASGCTVRGAHVSDYRTGVRLGSGCSGNFIEVYLENLLGSDAVYAADGSSHNILHLYRDGGYGNIIDQGWNTVRDVVSAGTDVAQSGMMLQNGRGEMYVEALFSYAPASGTQPIFKISLPPGAAAIVSVTMAGTIPSIHNYSEVSVWHICNNGGDICPVQLKERTTSSTGPILSIQTASKGEVTWEAINQEKSAGRPSFVGTIKIQGVGIRLDYPYTQQGIFVTKLV